MFTLQVDHKEQAARAEAREASFDDGSLLGGGVSDQDGDFHLRQQSGNIRGGCGDDVLYPYQSLDPALSEIRLFSLFPGEVEDEIRGTMENVPLGSEPTYEALSYSWGDPNVVLPIQVDGVGFKVTTNLRMALRRLRSRTSPRKLWIDATCINQVDDAEKSHQLMLMGRVYQSAARVVIWIGESFDFAGHGLYQLRRMLNPVSDEDDPSPGKDDPSPDEDDRPTVREESDTQIVSPQDLAADQRLAEVQALDTDDDPRSWYEFASRSGYRIGLVMTFRKEWWRRFWVVQEAILARRAVIICGSKRIPWPLPADLPRVIRELSPGGGDSSDTAGPSELDAGKQLLRGLLVLQQRYLQGTRPPLLELLELFKDRLCTNPKDRIFALLGLAREQDTAEFVKYDLSLSEVQMRFFKSSVALSQKLDILNCFDGPSRGNDHNPWAPFWNSEPEEVHALKFPRLGFRSISSQVQQFRLFSAAGNTVPEMDFSFDKQNTCVLNLRGFFVDRVTFVGDRIRIRDNSSESRPSYPTRFDWDAYARPTVYLWQEAACKVKKKLKSPYGEDREARKEAFWRTLIADTDPSPNGNGKPSGELSSTGFKKYMRYKSPFEKKYGKNPSARVLWNIDEDEWMSSASDRQEPEDCGFFNLGLRRAAFSRRFILTENGYMGLAPMSTKKGDCVCIFLGGRTPFVIRPTTRKRCRLIGESYIHGIMDGEAMENLTGGTYYLETISIL
jgi:hypothetical protein